MPTRNPDLHGNAPDKSAMAVLVIDMINDLEFPEGEQILPYVLGAAEKIAALRKRAHAAGVPVVYVNDNFGRWQSNFNAQVEHCLHDGVRGEPVARLLEPTDRDYFVLKPKHSGFFSTSLDVLLDYLEVQSLVLVGIATNICVLFTANDAYMRDLKLYVPRDCVAANTAELNENALEQMRQVLKADIRPSSEIPLSRD